MKELIINTPSVLNLKQRSASGFFSFIFWLLWFYLWIPLSTFLGWYLGFDLIHFQIIELKHNAKFIEELYFFAQALTLFGLSFAIWVAYNYYRFRDIERRSQAFHVSTKQLAEHYKVDISKLIEHQASKYVSVSFDEDGNITSHTSINLMDNKRFTDSLKKIPTHQ
ncbi:poly-beta-1,6-N-acetyl-D-glucosamine biosynthesis protein PgaD [Crenothrix sp.]|uniref:poly-beta-1,6-N-acetyl-D-glucosamine biosynthesis protein PgaD n=1 Tax=Crenothrix sp. TaxID=3100433 RepID=UPI00374DC053